MNSMSQNYCIHFVVPREDTRHTQSEPQFQSPMPLLLNYALSLFLLGETEVFCLLDLKEELIYIIFVFM